MAQTTNGKSAPPVLTNAEIAALLDETAGLLKREANPYRPKPIATARRRCATWRAPQQTYWKAKELRLERLPPSAARLPLAIEQIVDSRTR